LESTDHMMQTPGLDVCIKNTKSLRLFTVMDKITENTLDTH